MNLNYFKSTSVSLADHSGCPVNPGKAILPISWRNYLLFLLLMYLSSISPLINNRSLMRGIYSQLNWFAICLIYKCIWPCKAYLQNVPYFLSTLKNMQTLYFSLKVCVLFIYNGSIRIKINTYAVLIYLKNIALRYSHTILSGYDSCIKHPYNNQILHRSKTHNYNVYRCIWLPFAIYNMEQKQNFLVVSSVSS